MSAATSITMLGPKDGPEVPLCEECNKAIRAAHPKLRTFFVGHPENEEECERCDLGPTDFDLSYDLIDE